MEQIQIIDSKNHVGETVTIGAWVANKRSSGKIAFLQLRDGTAFFQGVVVKSEVSEEVFQTAKNLHQETSVLVTGESVKTVVQNLVMKSELQMWKW